MAFRDNFFFFLKGFFIRFGNISNISDTIKRNIILQILKHNFYKYMPETTIFELTHVITVNIKFLFTILQKLHTKKEKILNFELM